MRKNVGKLFLVINIFLDNVMNTRALIHANFEAK